MAGYIPYINNPTRRRFRPEYEGVAANVSIPIFNGHLFSARRRPPISAPWNPISGCAISRSGSAATFAWLGPARTTLTSESMSPPNSLRQASLALQLAQGRYDLGLSSIVELTQAQLNVTRPRSKISARSTIIRPSTRRSNTLLASSDSTGFSRSAAASLAPHRDRARDSAARHAWSADLAGRPGPSLGKTAHVQRERHRLDSISLADLLSPDHGSIGHRSSSRELVVAMRGLWRSRRIPLDSIQSVETIDHDIARDSAATESEPLAKARLMLPAAAEAYV